MTQLAKIQSEADAYKLIEDVRWNGTPECPHCGSTERISFLTPADGISRKTRTGKPSERRVWFCGACRKQFTALVGTIFHGTKVPIRTWLFVFYEMCANKNGIAAREIQRKYEVTAKTAWFMTQRIREAMKREPIAPALRGTVVADETYIGGSFKNMHKSQVKNYTAGRAGGPYDKTPVLSLIDTATGEVRSQVLTRVDGANLRKAIAEQCDMPNTILHTDKGASYNVVAREMRAHHTVDHKADEYVRHEPHGMVTTNQCEGFFSQLKRSIDGTHHHVSAEHLPRYLAEFDFRHTTRDMDDSARTQRLFGQVAGRRLSYRPLIGN